MNRTFKAAIVVFILALAAGLEIVYFAELRTGATRGRQLANRIEYHQSRSKTAQTPMTVATTPLPPGPPVAG